MSPKKRVGIIDYRVGNLFSVKHACSFVGLEPQIFSESEKIPMFDALILPGVGAFGEAMVNLKNLGLEKGIFDFIATGKPFLGICLGMQLLFGESEEFGLHKGLNIIPGRVVKFPATNGGGTSVRVPQIGWNTVFPPKKCDDAPWKGTALEGVPAGEFMYFVHSYYVVPEKPEMVLTNTAYEGITYCSSVAYKNVTATQFHPEKSAQSGLKIYQNWALSIQ